MKHTIPLLLLSLAFLGGCERSAPAGAPQPQTIQVVHAEFGLFNNAGGKNAAFVPSKKVPLTVNQAYGWVVKLNTNKAKVKWREEFTLPATPATWGGDPGGVHTVSPDKKVSILEREVQPVHGIVFNSWAVAKGDPRGRYSIRVVIEGAEPIVFDFDVG